MINHFLKKKFAIWTLFFSFVLFWGIFQINQGSGYDRVGPRFFPWLITVSLAFISLYILLKRDSPAPLRVDSHKFFKLILPLTLIFISLEYLGFIISMAILFAFVSYQIKKGPVYILITYGFIVSICIFSIFTYALDLNLPTLLG